MRSLLKTVCRRFWLFGIAIGSLVSLLVTAVMTTWDWVENPGGIFRDAAGTNWQFVYDTAISWLLPTFLLVAVVSSLIHLIFSGITRAYQPSSQTDGKDER